MDDSVVIWFLSQKQLFSVNQLICNFAEMLWPYSLFGFDVCLFCKQPSVKLVMVEVDEIQYAAEDGLAQIGLIVALGQYIENQVNILLSIKFHGDACDGLVSIFLAIGHYN